MAEAKQYCTKTLDGHCNETASLANLLAQLRLKYKDQNLSLENALRKLDWSVEADMVLVRQYYAIQKMLCMGCANNFKI